MRPAHAAVALLLLPAVAFAHDGHGHPEAQRTLLHWLLEPMHALPVLLGLAVAVGLVLRRRRAAR